jgi:hypothetical protein
MARWAVACMGVLATEFGLVLAVAFSGQDFSWKHDRIADLFWLVAGQAVVLLLGSGVCWLIGALRAVRRRAPLLRRLHAGCYVTANELNALRLDGPMPGNLVARAVHQCDRLASSRAWREGWLNVSVDDYELDATLWRFAQTGLATAAMMDAVNEAERHPELRDDAMAGQYEIAAALRVLRTELARMTTLADTTASIDAALANADSDRRRLHERDEVGEQLNRQWAALAAAREALQSMPTDLDAVAAITQYVTRELTPPNG